MLSKEGLIPTEKLRGGPKPVVYNKKQEQIQYRARSVSHSRHASCSETR